MEEQSNQAPQTVAVGANVVQEGATEPVVAPEEQEQEPKLSKDEIRDLLAELVEDVKSEKLTVELAQKLHVEIVQAKHDFIEAVKRVEEAINRVKPQ